MSHRSYPVGPGWEDLVDPIVEAADKKDISIKQVKEKFGALRIYIGEKDDDLRQMIAEAEAESLQTCEECGEDGERRSLGGWMKTLCDRCYDKMQQDLP